MLAIDLINSFRKILNDEDGDFDLSKETVLKILKSYEDELTEDKLGDEANLARIEHFYIGKREAAAQNHTANLEQYKTVNVAGQSAMRSLFIMNGGAAVAISAFIGTLANSPTSVVNIPTLAVALGAFAFGTFLASLAFGLTYLAHFSVGYDDEVNWREKLAHIFNGLAICSCVFSFGFFACGLLKGFNALS